MTITLIALAAFCLGGLLGWFLMNRIQSRLQREQSDLLVEKTKLETELHFLTKRQEELLQSQRAESELQRQSQKSELELQRRAMDEQFQSQRKVMTDQFQNLAQEILETKAKKFSEQTEKNLDVLLRPLKENLLTFEKSISEKYQNEAKERFHLKSEIERLMLLNDKMAIEANSLTRALRGDNKVQGDWGEMVLERILESSGLRLGQEYSTQVHLENDEGERLRPDVVINLPDDKHIIVDSKVSLRAFELFRQAEEQEGQKTKLSEAHLRDHLLSLENHIDQLSEKHYARLKGIKSPEFVFMFVPIEPAYILALRSDPELSVRAWKKRVAMVTSTTLFASLKTVASLWRVEKQNKNAMAIADEGGRLYDKFVSFLEDFEKIGSVLDSGQKQYILAMGKLKEGNGNVFKKMELLKELGAAPKKQIRAELLEAPEE